MLCKVYSESKIIQVIELVLTVKTGKVLGVGGRTTYLSQNARIEQQELFYFSGTDTSQDSCTRP